MTCRLDNDYRSVGGIGLACIYGAQRNRRPKLAEALGFGLAIWTVSEVPGVVEFDETVGIDSDLIRPAFLGNLETAALGDGPLDGAGVVQARTQASPEIVDAAIVAREAIEKVAEGPVVKSRG